MLIRFSRYSAMSVFTIITYPKNRDFRELLLIAGSVALFVDGSSPVEAFNMHIC